MSSITNDHDALVSAIALAITCPDHHAYLLPELHAIIKNLAEAMGGDEVLECQHQALALVAADHV